MIQWNIDMKNIIYSILILSIVLLSCSKESKTQKQEEVEFGISESTNGQVTTKKINYDSLLVEIDSVTKLLSANIDDLSLRKKYVSIAYDPEINMIHTSGIGKPLTNARTSTLAMNYAKKAATIEAYRWAAYVNEWISDIDKSPLSEINLESIKGIVVSSKILPSNEVQVLISVNRNDLMN
jgi:hypothetical protein